MQYSILMVTTGTYIVAHTLHIALYKPNISGVVGPQLAEGH